MRAKISFYGYGYGVECHFQQYFSQWQSVLLVEETGVPGENHWPPTRKEK